MVYGLLQWKETIDIQFLSREKKLADKPGFVPTMQAAAIHLDPGLPQDSSNLPGSSASHAIATLFGLAPDGGYRVSHPPYGLLVSVALFLASRRTAVSRHPALWSPDFPPLACASGGCLANFCGKFTIDNLLTAGLMIQSSARSIQETRWSYFKRQLITPPARNGISSSPAKGKLSGTFHSTFSRVIWSAFRGRP
ncbi:hypothetical protein SAMN05192560_0289 [Methylobacillus rhizosphaerae]|uniref:Uncharacterized protein n=1 Tax=Methylobacillus rhizosphaerae TaxID=551994 RepID=A0A238XZK0_9PROT|nr:hypothetical protein SAMN05192560_0289 [Methylobacillus rhizosphaerae]